MGRGGEGEPARLPSNGNAPLSLKCQALEATLQKLKGGEYKKRQGQVLDCLTLRGRAVEKGESTVDQRPSSSSSGLVPLTTSRQYSTATGRGGVGALLGGMLVKRHTRASAGRLSSSPRPSSIRSRREKRPGRERPVLF